MGHKQHLPIPCYDADSTYLENCRRILEYNDIRIVVQTAELVLEIWGSDLQADSRSPESLVIHGQIQSITLTPKGVRHGTASAE